MSDTPEQQKLDHAEQEMEAADQACAEMRVHLQRAKELVKTARKSLATSERRTWSEPAKR